MRYSKLVVMMMLLGLSMTGLVLAQRAQAPGERWDEDDVVTLEGTVTKVQRPFATFEAGGKAYSVHLGPIGYWERQGYSLDSGDRITITGQVSTEGKANHLYPHSMIRKGETYLFADSDGVPAWSRGGRGRWGGAGGGWHHGWRHGGHGCCGDCPHCPAGEGCPCVGPR